MTILARPLSHADGSAIDYRCQTIQHVTAELEALEGIEGLHKAVRVILFNLPSVILQGLTIRLDGRFAFRSDLSKRATKAALPAGATLGFASLRT